MLKLSLRGPSALLQSAITRLSPALFPVTPSITRLTSKSILSVSGSQAPEFLNGLLSSTIPTPGRPFFSAVLNAQGRVLYDLLVFSDHTINGRPAYLLEYDHVSATDVPPLYDLLRRYVLRAKVKIRDVSHEYDSWAAWNPKQNEQWDTQRNWFVAESGAIVPIWSNASNDWPWGSQEHIIRDRRAIGMGYRLLVRKGDEPLHASNHDRVLEDAYNIHRIIHGVPEGHVDITPNVAFPMDSNLDLMGAIDFKKGCYVGQELTVRTYHKGVIRKRTVPVLLQSSDSEADELEDVHGTFAADVDITPSIVADGSRARPRGSGKLLSSCYGLGLALLRSEHVEGVMARNLELNFMSGSGTKWSVTPLWPEWWPQNPQHPQL